MATNAKSIRDSYRDAINGTQFVYAIGSTKNKLVKIGFTTNISKRIQAIRTCSPFPVTLLALDYANDGDEARTHDAFREFRVHGEWFRLDSELSLALYVVRSFNSIVWDCAVSGRLTGIVPALKKGMAYSSGKIGDFSYAHYRNTNNFFEAVQGSVIKSWCFSSTRVFISGNQDDGYKVCATLDNKKDLPRCDYTVESVSSEAVNPLSQSIFNFLGAQ